MQRGRRSAAQLSIVPLDVSIHRSKLTPLGTLTRDERKVFDHVMHENIHLKPSDIPMLELLSISYCRCIRARRKDVAKWETEARVLMALATKLRCTVQASTFPNAAARRRAETENRNRERNPWDRNDPDDKP
jgi:hypothetical protein